MRRVAELLVASLSPSEREALLAFRMSASRPPGRHAALACAILRDLRLLDTDQSTRLTELGDLVLAQLVQGLREISGPDSEARLFSNAVPTAPVTPSPEQEVAEEIEDDVFFRQTASR